MTLSWGWSSNYLLHTWVQWKVVLFSVPTCHLKIRPSVLRWAIVWTHNKIWTTHPYLVWAEKILSSKHNCVSSPKLRRVRTCINRLHKPKRNLIRESIKYAWTLSQPKILREFQHALQNKVHISKNQALGKKVLTLSSKIPKHLVKSDCPKRKGKGWSR